MAEVCILAEWSFKLPAAYYGPVHPGLQWQFVPPSRMCRLPAEPGHVLLIRLAAGDDPVA